MVRIRQDQDSGNADSESSVRRSMSVTELLWCCTSPADSSQSSSMESVRHRTAGAGSPRQQLSAARKSSPGGAPRSARFRRASALLLLVALGPAGAWRATAQNTRHQTVLQPGGIPGIPVLTGITRVTNGLTVTWDSPAGYCQLYQKRSLTDPAWQAIGTPVTGDDYFHEVLDDSLVEGNRFYRVKGTPIAP